MQSLAAEPGHTLLLQIIRINKKLLLISFFRWEHNYQSGENTVACH